ncbi:MAG TPA: S8 family serine peptidase [Fibrobacteria bacterium]|nr:S8 family serine peptidase [Fibrobacteria bacterium]
MIRALSIPLLLLALCAPAVPAGTPADAPAPNLALSASFLPPRFVVGDSTQRAKLEKFLRQDRRDSSEWFRMRRNGATLSQGFLWRLAGEESGDTTGGETMRKRRALRRIERLAGVTLTESPVNGFPAGYVPNDLAAATASPQWGLINDGTYGSGTPGMDVDISSVWERFDGSDTLVIAVIDAGFNFGHPDLQDRWYVNPGESGMTKSGDVCWTGTAKDKSTNKCDDDANGFIDDWRGWDFVDEDNDPRDYHYHGTETSGVIAATFDNSLGVAGMLPRVKILPVRVLGTSGSGYSDDIAAGIRYAAKMKAKAANFSIGIQGTGTATGPDTALYNAFVVAKDSNMIIAAATANDALNIDANPRQPSSYGLTNVYNIAAHGANGALAGFSNYGATKADLAAPGIDIATTTIPPALSRYAENFEAFNASTWTISTSGGNPTWAVATDSMQGTKAFKWSTGVTTTAQVTDTLNMRGKKGGLLSFRLNYTPATGFVNDYLFLEYRPKGTSSWYYFGAIGSAVSNQTITLSLGFVDDTLYNFRLRTCRYTGLSGNVVLCSNTGTPTGRMVRVDDIKITYADLDSTHQAVYEPYAGGTSLAAPFFAGYAGLMRLAASRMGVPITRTLMLSGVTTVPALSGKVATGGRLDVAKGLDFYLKTLPRVQVNDSLVTSWSANSLVTYAFRAIDTTGVSIPDFVFTAVDKPTGSVLEQEGDFSWNTTGQAPGNYKVRVKGTYGPNTVRKVLTFSVTAVVGTSADKSRTRGRLWIGGRAFEIPPSSTGGRRAFRVEYYGADGRTLRTMVGELTLPPGSAADYRLAGFPAPGVRAWLDGALLQPAKD